MVDDQDRCEWVNVHTADSKETEKPAVKQA